MARTAVFEAAYLGSNPSSPANIDLCESNSCAKYDRSRASVDQR